MKFTEEQKKKLERLFDGFGINATFTEMSDGIETCFLRYKTDRFSKVEFDVADKRFEINTALGIFGVNEARKAMNELSEDIAIASAANEIIGYREGD